MAVIRRTAASVTGGATLPDGLAAEIRAAGPLNGERMLAALQDAAPDYVFLAGVGILRAESLGIPSVGTVNVHPGLLPWARGVGVVERSIERRVPVGLTAHFVDAGIDTGAVIRRELVPVSPFDTLTSLRLKAEERCVRLLAEVARIAKSGGPLEGQRQLVESDYCTWPSNLERRRIAADVREGVALRLYDAWRVPHGDVLPARMPEDERPLAAG